MPPASATRSSAGPGTRCPAEARCPSASTAPFAFPAPGGRVRLVRRTHERGGSAQYPALAAPELTYDPTAKGGTTTLTLDKHNDRVDEYVSLAGTWEQLRRRSHTLGKLAHLRGDRDAGRASGGATKDHGFVFEVDPQPPLEQPGPDTAHRAGTVLPRGGRRRP